MYLKQYAAHLPNTCTTNYDNALSREGNLGISRTGEGGFHDYLLIKQLLREYIRNVDWVHGGGCHNSRDRLFVQFVRLFVVESMTVR